MKEKSENKDKQECIVLDKLPLKCLDENKCMHPEKEEYYILDGSYDRIKYNYIDFRESQVFINCRNTETWDIVGYVADVSTLSEELIMKLRILKEVGGTDTKFLIRGGHLDEDYDAKLKERDRYNMKSCRSLIDIKACPSRICRESLECRFRKDLNGEDGYPNAYKED